MNRRFLSLAVFGPLWLVGLATDADAYKPGTDIDLLVRVENIADHPEFDFFLKFAKLGWRGEHESRHLVPLQSGQAAQIKSQAISEVFLVAVPRGQKIDEPDANAAKDSWLRNAPQGALQTAALTTVPKGALLPGHPGDRRRRNSEIVYRVRIEGAAIEAICVEWISFEKEESTPWLGYGLLAGLGVCVMVFLFRNFSRSIRKHNVDQPSDPSAE